MKHRIFIAINLPIGIKKELLFWQKQKKFKNLNVRWTKPENLHFTLAFIGYVSEKEIEKIFDATEKIVSKISPFLIEFSRICPGPSFQKARMIWIEGKMNENLKKIDKELKTALIKEKIDFDNRYPLKIHITLARTRNNELKDINLNEELKLTFVIKSVEVMKSKLSQNGVKYKVLKKCFLK